MACRFSRLRNSKRGGALAISMLFFVLVAIAGAAMLSISSVHRLQTVRNGIDVRLMIAAEAGIETVRGRFTVVPDIQEDWTALLPTPGWNEIERLSINGMNVTVEAQPVGGPSVPTARVRSTAVAGAKSRTVEYTIKVATFSDYAVFNADSGMSTLGPDYKGVGNLYFAGNVNIPNSGAQLFGKSHMVGSIVQGYGPGNNPGTGQPWNYHFPIEPPAQNQPPIPIPTWAAPWDSLENVARSPIGHFWAENTLAIELTGTTYTRYYVERVAANGNMYGAASGNDWLLLSSAVSVAPGARLRTTTPTPGNEYRLAQQTGIPIPDEGIIYVATGSVSAVNPSRLGVVQSDSTSGTNTWVQPTNWASNASAATVPATVGSDYDIVRNNGMPGDPFAKVLLLWGNLDDRRVSIACDHKIVLADKISYQSLLDNPQWRIFHGDGLSGKQSPGALGFKEMLGVMSREDSMLTPTWWRPVLPSQAPGVTAGDIIPGHFPADAYPMDGVIYASYDTRPHRHRNNLSVGEFWGHGGLIAGGSYAAGMGNHFRVRNYHWDFRLALTTPPYFLRAYNVSAIFLPGTWRTYEN
jgi:hypothetical protein